MLQGSLHLSVYEYLLKKTELKQIQKTFHCLPGFKNLALPLPLQLPPYSTATTLPYSGTPFGHLCPLAPLSQWPLFVFHYSIKIYWKIAVSETSLYIYIATAIIWSTFFSQTLKTKQKMRARQICFRFGRRRANVSEHIREAPTTGLSCGSGLTAPLPSRPLLAPLQARPRNYSWPLIRRSLPRSGFTCSASMPYPLKSIVILAYFENSWLLAQVTASWGGAGGPACQLISRPCVRQSFWLRNISAEFVAAFARRDSRGGRRFKHVSYCILWMLEHYMRL